MPDWKKQVWKMTAKRGIDHMIEAGGADTLAKSFQAGGMEARLASSAFSADLVEVNFLPVLFKRLSQSPSSPNLPIAPSTLCPLAFSQELAV
jgi:NADPH:quinone reductase-like Zn-dependent oxidoreductase